MSAAAKKIFCPACRQESALKVEKIYHGLTPAGERKVCAFCGYEFADGEPEAIADRPPGWTGDEELRKICRRCRHYVVNPFVEKCVLHSREVEATDTCPDFTLRPPPPPEKKEEPPPSILGPPPKPPQIF
jgi:rubredoxin